MKSPFYAHRLAPAGHPPLFSKRQFIAMVIAGLLIGATLMFASGYALCAMRDSALIARATIVVRENRSLKEALALPESTPNPLADN